MVLNRLDEPGTSARPFRHRQEEQNNRDFYHIIFQRSVHMFGSIILEVFIGLVLIYFLYSLLATIINELIASFLGLRAKTLEQSLEKMLADKDPKATVLSRKLIDAFKNHPLIEKTMSGVFFKKLPSFIATKDFSTVVLDCLKTLCAGKDGIALNALSQGLSSLKQPIGAKGVESGTIKLMESFLANANNDLEKFREQVENWFDTTMDRVSGWYKRWTQVWLFAIGLALAIGFNVDTIKIVGTLSKDKDAREQLISIAQTYTKAGSPNTVDSLKADSLLAQAARLVNSDIKNSNAILGMGWNTGDSSNRPLMLVGWLITALAISLGSPLWFDLLSKLMKLRGTGATQESGAKLQVQ
jgi:hypothetical protein